VQSQLVLGGGRGVGFCVGAGSTRPGGGASMLWLSGPQGFRRDKVEGRGREGDTRDGKCWSRGEKDSGRREVSRRRFMTSRSSCSWVTGVPEGGVRVRESLVAGAFLERGTGLAEQPLSPAEWSSTQLGQHGEEVTQQLRTGGMLPSFG